MAFTLIIPVGLFVALVGGGVLVFSKRKMLGVLIAVAGLGVVAFALGVVFLMANSGM